MPKVKLLWHGGLGEKNEYENENEYDKKRMTSCAYSFSISLSIYPSPSLTLPRKIGEGSCGVTAARWAVYFRPRQFILLTYTF
jgi:hypothetical protein